MDVYSILNMVLLVVTLSTVFGTLLQYRAWRNRRATEYARVRELLTEEAVEELYHAVGLPAKEDDTKARPSPSSDMRDWELRIRLGRIDRISRQVTTLTSLVATMLAALAVSDIAGNNQTQALAFNAAALATLIITKGGLFLLTAVLLPAVKSIPAAITGAVISKKVGAMMSERKNKRRGEEE